MLKAKWRCHPERSEGMTQVALSSRAERGTCFCGTSDDNNARSLYCAGLHVDQLPDMAVQVLKSVSIHEAVVFRLFVRRSATIDRLANHLIDFRAALAR